MTFARGLCRVTLVGLTVLGVAGCGVGTPGSAPAVVKDVSGGPTLNGTDIGDVITRPRLALTDTAGRRFDLRHRPADELTVLFFGYTNCPDLCPTTMADLAAAQRKLTPVERAWVTVAFVTEDPATDTPRALPTATAVGPRHGVLRGRPWRVRPGRHPR